MSKNPENNESKALPVAGIENKSLEPVAENKAAQPAPKPAEPERVRVIVAHPVPAGRIGNDKDLRPGDETRVPAAYATQLIQQGVARLA